MPKKKAPSPQKPTHFEKVPLEAVVKVAVVDPPLALTPAVGEPIAPRPPSKLATRTKS